MILVAVPAIRLRAQGEAPAPDDPAEAPVAAPAQEPTDASPPSAPEGDFRELASPDLAGVGPSSGGGGDFRELPPVEEPPLGSALFSGKRISLYDLFERDTNPVPKDKRLWPDVGDPGPDLGDFPNSAYTVPKGRCYIELAPVTWSGPDTEAPSDFIAPFLLRYGVTDDVEFRLFSSGITHVFGDNSTTGFSPLNIDLKIHLWDDKREWLLPASSLEVYLVSTWGSPQFTTGWQPSLNMNFDLPLGDKTNLEWTVGYSGVQSAVNIVTGNTFVPRRGFIQPSIHRFDANIYQLSVQWALEHEVTEKLTLFTHGFYNGGILIQQGTGIVVGGGFFWEASPSLMYFGSVNAGVTPDLPPLLVQLGVAIAVR